MRYIYGDFTDKQINEAVRAMHGDIHNLLLYKDKTIEEKIFEDDEAFLVFFENVMFKLGGTKTLFNDNGLMVTLLWQLYKVLWIISRATILVIKNSVGQS